MKKYVWLNRAFDVQLPKDKAQEVGDWLNSLPVKSTEGILKAASVPSSPIYEFLEWDDKKAAHNWRLNQVRKIVCAIGIETKDEPMRAFENVVLENHREYMSMDKISRSPELVDQVILSAMNDLKFWKMKNQKYQTYFGGVFEAIDVAEETIRSKSEKEEGSSVRRRVSAGHKDRNTTDKKAGRGGDHRRRLTAVGK